MDWITIRNEANETIIDITDVIGSSWGDNETTHETVYNSIKGIKDLSNSKITVNIINSPGGSVAHALAIYDLLTTSKAKIVTNGFGVVASAATIIFMAGSKGNRNLSPNAKWLTHRMTIGMQGNTDQIKADLKDAEKWEKNLVDIMVKASNGKKDDDDIWCLMNENEGTGNFKDANEVIEMGFADKIMTTYKNQITLLSNEKLSEYKLPIINNNINQNEMELLNEIKNMFAEIKNAIIKQPVEAVENTPVDHTEKLTEIENKIQLIETVNTELTATNTQLSTEATELTNQITAKDAAILDLQNQIVALNKAAGTEIKAKSTGSQDPLAQTGNKTPEQINNEKVFKKMMSFSKDYEKEDPKDAIK